MNSEIIRLQYEINQLRKQNLEKQKQINFIPLNIISNNLYIDNSPNNRIPKKININKNARYNSFINKNKNININNSFLSINYGEKKNKSYGKLPFKKGMFSYKNSIIGSTPNNAYRIFNNNTSSNKRIAYKYNNNNSLLSANLNLNIDNDENDNNISQNIYIHGKIPSSSSFDLNKYKIDDRNINNFNNLNKSTKNLNISNISQKNSDKKVNNNSNNASIFLTKNNKNNNSKKNNNIIINNMNNNKNKFNQYSIDLEKMNISPIIPKLINPNEKNSSSLLANDDYKYNINKSAINNKKRRIFDHFRDKPKYEKESRRMIIEYLKVLKKINNRNNYIGGDINKIMTQKNISKKVLNKEIIAKEFNTSNIFNNSVIIKNNNNINNEINSEKSSLNDSLINNFNNSVMNINNKVLSKNFSSPIKNNINNFLTNMNDEKKDKINMVKMLSVPKIMNLFFQNIKYKYICFLCPNNICYINGIEGYIFKFFDIKSCKFVGGFDLVKVSLCTLNSSNPNNFIIETYDGKEKRKYEFETNSKDRASYYVKSINYLARLEKCKIYNNKNIFQ